MDKIKELLLSLGLTKIRDYDHDSFFLLSSKVQLFGEVIRIWDKEQKIVFFTKLKERSSPTNSANVLHIPYTHLYSIDLDRIPDKFKAYKGGNHFYVSVMDESKLFHNFDLNTNENNACEFLKWLVTDCNKQKKELEQKIELDKIDEDFE
jgi:hypothetical protein